MWLTILVLFASVQLVAPGFGSDWFGDDFRPDGWAADEKWTYLLTEAIPLVVFVAVGAIFYLMGAATRRDREPWRSRRRKTRLSALIYSD